MLSIYSIYCIVIARHTQTVGITYLHLTQNALTYKRPTTFKNIILIFFFVLHFLHSLMKYLWTPNTFSDLGSGCGSVGRAVASYSRGLRFKSSLWQNLYCTFVYYIGKTKIKNKEAHLKIKLLQGEVTIPCPKILGW